MYTAFYAVRSYACAQLLPLWFSPCSYVGLTLSSPPLFIHSALAHALLSTPNLLLFQSTLQVPPPLLLHNPETQPSACMLLSTLPPSSPLQPTSSPLATQIEAWPQECFANGLESIRPLIFYTLIPLCLYLSSYWINVCCCC